MKIRIRDNSIRLRLTRGEVDRLHRDGVVISNTDFSDGGRFSYSIKRSSTDLLPTASFLHNTITVHLPEESVRVWAVTEQVSIVAEQALDDGRALSILIEKDFSCLVPRTGEDESDMYPHPDTNTVKC